MSALATGGVEVALRGIAKRFGAAEVLAGIELEIAAGELVVLLGRSGCGKSTLLRIVCGLEEPSAGEVWIGGREVTALEPRERNLAMVFQSYALYPHMTVRDNIAFPLRIRRVAKAERERRVREVAALLGLEQLLDRRPAQLSGGQRQRVAIARALVRQPPLYLFDEPLSNLDAALRTRMRAELRALHARLGATMLYVTHDQIEAMTLADRIVVLEAGRIQQVGRPEEIYRAPANRFVATFVGSPAMNLIPGEVQGGRFRAQGAPLELVAGSARSGPAELGIRPEHVLVALADAPQPAPPAAPAPAAPAWLTGEVELSEPVGDRGYLHLRAGELVLRASVPGPEAFRYREGARVRAAIDPAHTHLFDARTGERWERQEP
ncbi:MAG: sugar ABC transporter ATP-binding protein [Planctomycetota bacterium]|nr:MAG: sugar ABC transporter ATP-binding protein [Planctomycetota bacterium]